MDYASDQYYDDPKQELTALVTERVSAIKRQMGEIKAQIEQTQMMVNREQQRNSDYATELQNIQNNLDTVPREDIRDKYNEAIDARFRLATMRGQLEKFQTNYENMEHEQVLLTKILGQFQGVDVLDSGDDEISDPATRSTANIVRIVEAQEEERQRLAHQMHDGPAQSLTNFILQAEICQRLFDRNPERAGEELSVLKENASITFQKVRDFIFDLRPMMLDDLGVIPTIRRYVESFKEKNDIETALEIMGDERRLESHREVMVFRAVQELMGHARDYAMASRLQIKLDISGNVVKIAIQDNGRGFDAEAIFSESEDVHLDDARSRGVINLRQRFELVGGTMSVQSSESEGTSIRLELPAQ
jgi:two-component system sensor histidine kinase DegS